MEINLPTRVVRPHSGWHTGRAANLLPTHEDRCRDHHTKGNRRCLGSVSMGHQVAGSDAVDDYDHIARCGLEYHPTVLKLRMDVIGLAGDQRLPR